MHQKLTHGAKNIYENDSRLQIISRDSNSSYLSKIQALVEIQALLDSLNLLLGSLGATVVAASALEGWILHLDIELDLRLST